MALRAREMPTVGLVTVGHFFSHFYFLVLPPLFPLLRNEFGLSNAELGLLISVMSVGMLLQVPIGALVDRIGAKWILVIGMALTSLGILLIGVATSYLLMVAFATLSGVGQSAFHPADYPLLEAVSDEDRLGRNFGVHTFGGYAGSTIAPLLVGGIGFTAGWRPALITVGATGVIFAVVLAVALAPAYLQQVNDATSKPSRDVRASRRSPFGLAILVMAAFFVVITMAEMGVQTFTPLLALDGFQFSETIGNMALSAFFGLTAVGVLVGGLLADRFEPRYIILGATTLAGTTVLVVVAGVVSMDPAVFVLAFAITGTGFGLVFASRDRLVSSYTAAGSTGTSFGFVFTASSVGALASPLFLGIVIDFVSTGVAFTFVGVFFLLSGFIVLLVGGAPPIARLRSRFRTG